MVSFCDDYTSGSASTLFSYFHSDTLPDELVDSLYGELNTPSVVPSSSSSSQESIFGVHSPDLNLDSDDLLSSFTNEDLIEQLLSSDEVDFHPEQQQQSQFQSQSQPQQPPFQFQYSVEQVNSPNPMFYVSSPTWSSSSSSVPSSPFASSPFLSSPVSPATAYWVPLSPNSNLMYSATPSYSAAYAPTLLKGPLTSNDCALCEIIPAKKVSVSVRGKPLITTTLKEFYGERIREEAITNALLLDAHPQFTSHDDAVGSIYILRNVSARKPPQIAKKAFNCHTRKEAGLAHWQYNVPGTDFTCRVSEWTIDGVMHNSYHYYRSPLARPSRRVKPY